MDGDARGDCAGGGAVAAGSSGGREAVRAAGSDCVSDFLRHPGDACAAGADAAVGDPDAGPSGTKGTELRGERSTANRRAGRFGKVGGGKSKRPSGVGADL